MNIVWYGNDEGMYRGWWDMGIFEDLFSDGTHYEGIDALPEGEGAIVILPARALAGKEMSVNEKINELPWCVLIVAGDEEGSFNIDRISHKNIIIWAQYPYPTKHQKYKRIGCGYPPLLRQITTLHEKSIFWSFAGQDSHERRHQAIEELENIPLGVLVKTSGFAQGISQAEYYELLSKSRVVICPSGPETVDTFRVYESLDLGCIPIADTKTPKDDWSGFWEWLFSGEVPFPYVQEWSEVSKVIDYCAENYPALNNRVQAWWMRYLEDVRRQFREDVQSLRGTPTKDLTTIIVPVSSLSSHPDTSIIEETIKSIRFHFPDSEIILTFDGLREEHQDRREAYEEHIRRVLWLARSWRRVSPIIFEEHTHQVGMARKALERVKTPLILYVEQDTPLVTDEPIEWSWLESAIALGKANVIRLHFEAHIPKEHAHLMIGELEGHLQPTIQWSQRPHLASADFYRAMLSDNFSPNALCFIEDHIHGVVQDDYGMDGQVGWDWWKLFIYVPNDTNIKRSYHTDGRQGDKKYDEDQVW